MQDKYGIGTSAVLMGQVTDRGRLMVFTKALKREQSEIWEIWAMQAPEEQAEREKRIQEMALRMKRLLIDYGV